MTASLRAALSGADLLGFSTRRGDAPSAKAAFVGVGAPAPGQGGSGGGTFVSNGNGGRQYAGGGFGGVRGHAGGAGNSQAGAGGSGANNNAQTPSGGRGGHGGSGGNDGFTVANGSYVRVSGAVGGAGGPGGPGADKGAGDYAGGGGGGGGGGGAGVYGAAGVAVSLTIAGAVTGGAGGAGGNAGAGPTAAGFPPRGGVGGYGGSGVLADSGTVTVLSGGSVTGGAGGPGGAATSGGNYVPQPSSARLGTGVTFTGTGAGAVDVRNGATVTGADRVGSYGQSGYGVVASPSGSALTVTNAGVIHGGAGVAGATAVSSPFGGALRLMNTGSITGGAGTTGDGGAAVSGLNSAVVNNYASGVIRGGDGLDGGNGLTLAQSASITNAGTIAGGAGRSGFGGVGVFGSNADSLTNTGSITGGAASALNQRSGAGVYFNGSDNGVQNTGSITGGAGGGAGVYSAGGGVTNMAGGSITGGAAQAGQAVAANYSIGLAGSGLQIVNSGAISGGAGANGTRGYAIAVDSGSSLQLSAADGVGTITGAIAASGNLTIDPGTAASVTLSSAIVDNGQGPGAVTKAGANTLVLTGASTYTGATTVSAGVLEIGQGGSLTSAITVNAGTLRGVGSTTGAVSVASGATFAPGNAAGTGTFTIGSTTVVGAGGLSLPSGATFAETLTSAAAYGTVNVAGPITLGGSLSLTIAPGAVLPVGTIFTLIHEAGSAMPGPFPGSTIPTYPTVTTTFAGQAEGSSITVGGYTFTVSYRGGAHADDVTLTETAAPVFTIGVANATPTMSTGDKTADRPFSGVTITDPLNGQETVTVSYDGRNGALAGTGFTAANAGAANASFTGTFASPAAAQAALQALTFTPAQNLDAVGQSRTTTFNVGVADGAASGATTEMVTVTSVNDPAAFGNFQTAATQTPATPVLLQTGGLTVTDPDANASVQSAFVSVVSGGVAGDVLAIQGTLPTGITAAYDSANFVLSLSGGSTDAAYAQALRQVTFVHQGATDASTRSIAFNVVDDQGERTRSTNETVSVGAVSGYTGPTTPAQTPSQQAGYTTQGDNLIRVAPTDPALSDPTNPVARQVAAEQAIAARLDTGQISAADAQSQLFHLVDGTTSVAEISYAFFTGRTPTQAGLNYLVNSAANPTDLNDAYYARFTVENRYINFASNLATGQGAGAAAFQTNYGALSLSDATAKAYQAVFGITPTADKVTAILNEQVANGLGGTETRAQYLADITGGSAIAQKAAVVGFLLADSVKEGFGTYQQADLHFLQDLAHGTAAFNVDLLAAYGVAPTLVGQPVLDPSLGS